MVALSRVASENLIGAYVLIITVLLCKRANQSELCCGLSQKLIIRIWNKNQQVQHVVYAHFSWLYLMTWRNGISLTLHLFMKLWKTFFIQIYVQKKKKKKKKTYSLACQCPHLLYIIWYLLQMNKLWQLLLYFPSTNITKIRGIHQEFILKQEIFFISDDIATINRVLDLGRNSSIYLILILHSSCLLCDVDWGVL